LKEAERQFLLALVGDESAADRLIARLSSETGDVVDNPVTSVDIRPYIGVYASQAQVPSGAVILHVEDAETEARLAEALARLSAEHPVIRLALARRIPAFRPPVAAQIIADVSWTNARIALISALPGVIPLMEFLLPATALGDMAILTRNQAEMILRLAAAYGLPVNLRARMRELLPVVGSAFGWRAVAREVVGIVPGGIGVVVKGSIAYAGTYSVGKAAVIYYSTGQLISPSRLRQLYADAYRAALGRVKEMARRIKRGRNGKGDSELLLEDSSVQTPD
jgi:uncharacterized protein (DUF697 family)